jgi:hypothetical protein
VVWRRRRRSFTVAFVGGDAYMLLWLEEGEGVRRGWSIENEGARSKRSPVKADSGMAQAKSMRARVLWSPAADRRSRGWRRRCCTLLPSEKGAGKENDEEGGLGRFFSGQRGEKGRSGESCVAPRREREWEGPSAVLGSGSLAALSEVAAPARGGGGLGNRGGRRGARDAGRRGAGG